MGFVKPNVVVAANTAGCNLGSTVELWPCGQPMSHKSLLVAVRASTFTSTLNGSDVLCRCL
jgi:hypothetical protein